MQTPNDKPVEITVDALTGEEVVRELTDAEIQELQIKGEQAKQEREQEILAEQEKKANRSALLNRLGLTEEEAKLLLS
jgi:hypothetical protein